MATDYSSSPITPKGKIIMGIGCGLITSIIRLYGGYPEGVSYSILLMNIATPLIDKFTKPRVFGEVKGHV
jgi:electron transport complex protein RnfD